MVGTACGVRVWKFLEALGSLMSRHQMAHWNAFRLYQTTWRDQVATTPTGLDEYVSLWLFALYWQHISRFILTKNMRETQCLGRCCPIEDLMGS